MANKSPSLEELISLAWQALVFDQLKLAMQHAQQANRLAPNSPEVAHILGILASRDGKPDIALPLLQKAIDAGPTAQKLRHITEALLVAGHAKAALAPISDAVKNYPPESDTFGLLAAVQVALEQWNYAIKSAQAACQLNPNTAIWQSTLSFCQLMQQNWVDGFESFTARAENLGLEARSPALHKSSPCDLWIKNEQGPGDTLFFARYAPHLAKQGYRLHIQTDHKTLPLLQETKVFASVFVKMKHKKNADWISAGDLPLAAIQTASEPIAPALQLAVDAQRTKKIQAELAKLGPAPYIAITWRGGPKGRKQRAGVRMYEKFIDPTLLGNLLKGTQGTLISIQRLPESDEFVALCKAVGKHVVDWSSLNNNLQGMLSFLSLADAYFAVPNTNVHLRESVGKPSHVFLNRPFQDWRWLAEGNTSPWYPNTTIYRQSQSGDWNEAIEHAQKNMAKLSINSDETPSKQANVIDESDIKESLWQRTIADGWEAIDNENIPLAIQKAQEVLSQAPNHARALHLLGWAAVTDMKFDIALQLLKKSADLSPQDGIVWRDLVRGLTLNGLYQEAIDTATLCLNSPDMRSKSALHYALAAVYYKLGNETKALEHYDECLQIAPNNLDAIAYSGMIRMKMGSGHARIGFKQYSARKESRREDMRDFWVCPTLKGDISGLKILLVRDMGLGDELTYLRYLPWLVNSGAQVDYWCGAKLESLLNRSNLGIKAISDRQPMPQPSQYDLAFIVTDLPAAVEYLGAPEIAPPLPIHVRADLIEKWKAWLAKQGKAPYIGLNWRAGVASQDNAVSFTKLAKAIEPEKLASTLSNVEATWISLQRNVTKMELNSFEQILGAPLHDAAGLTDDLEDLLALLSLLDANVGVSNTNMHLRAGLGLGSHVLVQNPGGDWRWGATGNQSVWFEQSIVYRQLIDGNWSKSLDHLQHDLCKQFGKRQTIQNASSISKPTAKPQTKRLIWITGGNFIKDEHGNLSSVVASTRNRVIAPAKGLHELGWKSDYINEAYSQTMGGWDQCIPQAGDTVIISKVFTDHAIKLAQDAKARGAQLIVDFCDNFLDNPKRAPLQRALVEQADKLVCSETSIAEAFSNIAQQSLTVIENLDLDNINQDLVMLWQSLITMQVKNNPKSKKTNTQLSGKALKRVLVGMMYSGENEYEQAKHALQNQTHQNFELFEVKNLPNKLAHDTLYAKFMERSKEFDYFLKLDADMVFAHEQVLAEMVESMVEKNYAHLFAYVKDCPSNLMIPGIQMFRSDTQWLGSDEQLNVDYFPKLYGDGNLETNQNWILHMPNPSKDQLFRYGIHKALKAIQPQLDSREKIQRKAILHINILAGIARNLAQKPDLKLSLMGATLVFSEQFSSIEYNGDIAKSYFEKLENDKFYAKLESLSQTYWANEIQIYYKWLELFSQNNPQIQNKTKVQPKAEVANVKTLSVKKSTKNIIWITAGTLDTSQGYVNSNLASTRYRVLIPAANLGVFGWESQIVNEDDLVNHGWDKLNLSPGDTVIVSKSLNPALINALQQAKVKGCKIVVDFCDNHFERPDNIGQHQNNLLQLANKVTTCSPQLKEIIESKSQTTVIHITDSFEGQKKPATFSIATPANLLWFGNQINFDTLYPLLDALRNYSKKTPINLNIVTLIPNGESIAKTLSQEKLTVQYTPWSQQNLAAAMRNCDMVVIPTLKNENKSVKSPNRIIEPLWAGKYVVAGHLPAYEPFVPFASIGDDLVAGIEWALNHPEQVLEKIKAGQAYIAANHTPKLIGEKWNAAITQLAEMTTSEQQPAQKQNVNSPLDLYFQPIEAARVLGVKSQDIHALRAAYDNRYPAKVTHQTAKIAVYTAIFGGYDSAPVLNHIEPALDYILYTDNPAFNAPAPWQVRVVPAQFADPQMDARRIKVLSHQFLPDYDISVWIDGNFTLEKLTKDLVKNIASRAPLALCKYQFRNCIYDEAVEILKRGLDASTPVLKQMQYYQARQFPAQYNLHATSFLVRDHKNASTVKFNMRWWELISTYSKRDQLSFDYVCWEQNIEVVSLPFNLRDNALYFWGKNGERKHVGQVRRNDEHSGRMINTSGVNKLAFNPNSYQTAFDSWHQSFLLDLYTLNQTLLQAKQAIAPSILYTANSLQLYTACNLPDIRLGEEQRSCIDILMQSKRILQLGDDSGHFALLAMHYGSAKLVYAQELHAKQHPNIWQQYLTSQFQKRFATFSENDLSTLDASVFDTICITAKTSKEAQIYQALVSHLTSTNTTLIVQRLAPENLHQEIIYPQKTAELSDA